MDKDWIESHSRNALEMQDAARDQFQPMVDLCCGNLEIGIRDEPAGLFQMHPDHDIYPGRGNILAGRTS